MTATDRRHRRTDYPGITLRAYVFLTSSRYHTDVLQVHAILGVRASPNALLRADGFPGSHGPGYDDGRRRL